MQDDSSEYDYDWSDDYENLDATGTLTQVGCMAPQAAVQSSDVQLCSMAAAQLSVACCVAGDRCLQSCASFMQQPGNDTQHTGCLEPAAASSGLSTHSIHAASALCTPLWCQVVSA